MKLFIIGNKEIKLTISKDWEKLLQVMSSVHQQNRGFSEEKVYQDVQRVVGELRQEEYERKHNENQAS